MIIAMDYRKYDGVIGGVERAVIEITKYVAQQGHTVLLMPKVSRLDEVERDFEGTPNLQIFPLDVPSHIMSLRNVYFDSFRIQSIAKSAGADILHFPYNWSFPLHKVLPTLLTIHDVIPLTFREAMGILTNRFLYRPGMRLATRTNDRIATVSEFSKADIAQQLHVPLEKIKVIPNGLRNPFPPTAQRLAELTERYQIQGGFILYVGGIHERKNVVRLIHAFGRMIQKTDYSGQLLITGKAAGAPYQDRMRIEVDAAIAEANLGTRVTLTGFIPDEKLDALMSQAQCMIYPSLYEGFGIPVLEAMRAGTPVITSNLTALPEVAGGAALLIDPLDVEGMASTMAQLLVNPSLQEELKKKGKDRASSYSWQNTAEMYLNLYQEVIETS